VTSSELPAVLQPLVADPERSAILLDFDGTLGEIVARPELARPVDGAREVLRDAVARFGWVAVISGRPTEEVRSLVGVDGVRYVGLYGLEEGSTDRVPQTVMDVAHQAASLVPGAWVEDKGGSVAVHYRQATDAASAHVEVLTAALAAVPEGFEAIEGKMVVEIVPAGRSRKGGAVRRLVAALEPAAVLYAGDDLADLEAFEVLDALRGHDRLDVALIAVAGPETPPSLVEAADHVVEGPPGLVTLLRALVEPSG
jgi:trehalose 6-phosphate phosphatase